MFGCYCGSCGKECEPVFEQHGLDREERISSSCCAGSVYGDAYLTEPFEGDQLEIEDGWDAPFIEDLEEYDEYFEDEPVEPIFNER